LPPVIVQVGVPATIGPPPIGKHEPVSVVEKPLPVTVTVIPVTPELGVSTILGPVTVNVACAESPVEPVTVTVYVPGDTPPTKKLPLGVPLPAVIVHVGVVTRVLGPIVQGPVSPNENPVPVTVTVDPSPPDVGERVILALPGGGPVTLNAAVPDISPVLPLTWTRYVPGVAVFATVKLLPVNAPEADIAHETDVKRTGLAGDCK
jgi:hypothetical protein